MKHAAVAGGCGGRLLSRSPEVADHHAVECQPETLIIGAGPAGLAVAACLKKRGAPFVILERATEVGSSWRRHYDRLHLHTVKDQSALPYLDFPAQTPRYPSRDQTIAYLERYANHFGLIPQFDGEVSRVTACDQGWITTTKDRTYHSKQVVVATGYNAIPHVPTWPGQERFRGRLLHSSEYRNGNPFRGQSVLVIGFGNSGGEIAMDLHEHGAQVTMSVRGTVNVVPREIFHLSIVTVSIALSRLPARVADAFAAPLLRLTIGDLSKLGFRPAATGPITQIKKSSRVPLIDIGTIGLVRADQIGIRGGVRSMDETHVIFEDGTSSRFDAIVLATGFRPGVERFLQPPHNVFVKGRAHGKSRFMGDDGLYFCGFSVSPTGMLRDIAMEARWIAEHITRRPST
jgi:indole-3-pyruvate monooxygenase